jgi:RNA polymerase sigma factor (sigma-70 family)
MNKNALDNIETIYTGRRKTLVRAVLRHAGKFLRHDVNHAEDVLQDAVGIALTNHKRYGRAPKSVYSNLLGIAVELAKRNSRSPARRKEVPLTIDIDSEKSQSTSGRLGIQEIEIEDSLNTLSNTEKTTAQKLIEYRTIDDTATFTQIADSLGISRSTLYHRRKSIKEKLESNYF